MPLAVDAGRYAADPSDVLQLIVQICILDVHDQSAHIADSVNHQDTLFLIIDIKPFIKVLAIHLNQMTSKSFTIRLFR